MNTVQEYFVVLDDALGGRCRYYQDWVRCDAVSAERLAQVDGLLQTGWQQGLHVVLWAAYDFGSGLVLGGGEHALYLLWFARCDVLADNDARLPWRTATDAPSGVLGLHNPVSREAYLQQIAAIHAAIGRGEVYQINYTTEWQGTAYGEPARLYARLRARQNVPYGVLACVPPEVNGGAAWHLGFSPELFWQLDDDGNMTAKPMKGTAPILNDGRDAERAATLRQDAKNRAENVMIVDLLRNDLGKLAQIGGVSVPQAFEVAAFGAVWQMTSTVRAALRDDVGIADIISATFPCGSITGAPKRMAMQLIEQLEQYRKRGIYTGSIGYLEPCAGGIGMRGVCNVVIRSLNLREQAAQQYALSVGIGSGIVIDSKGEDEWEECLWKARFVRELPPEVGLIETLRIDNGVCRLLARHSQRLHHSLRELQIACDEAALWQGLQDACANEWQHGVWRAKCQVSPDGNFIWTAAPLSELSGRQRACVCDQALPIKDVLRRHKTDYRAVFDAAWQAAARHGCFDALLFNENGALLEGGRSSVFVKYGAQWLTPCLSLDILDGVMRRAIVSNPAAYGFDGNIVEHAAISRDMLQNADKICISNALRGVLEVDLMECAV